MASIAAPRPVKSPSGAGIVKGRNASGRLSSASTSRKRACVSRFCPSIVASRSAIL